MFVFIDSAVTGCNIAIADDSDVLAMHQEPITRGHAEFIMPLFQSMLRECQKQPQDISKVIVTVGPGSFTGLRVGLTTAQTMAYALARPVHGITSFQTFSCAIQHDNPRMVVVDTKRDDYYIQMLDGHHEPVSDPMCMLPDDIKSILQHGMTITGDGVEKISQEIDLSCMDVVPQNMIDLNAVTQALINNQLSLIEAKAFYIRDADVSKPKASTR